jgi:hypothetical protein
MLSCIFELPVQREVRRLAVFIEASPSFPQSFKESVGKNKHYSVIKMREIFRK